MSDDPLAQFTKVDGSFDEEAAHELVHARYLGDTQVQMPDLGFRERCCQAEHSRSKESKSYEKAHAAGEEGLGTHPHVTLNHGDVILLDRWSAVGRDDFEIVEKSGAKKAPERAPAVADAQTP